ncbi:hypothetical protein [Halobacillus sp. H74]
MKLSYFELMTMIYNLAEEEGLHTVDELCEHLQENGDKYIEIIKE